MAIIGAATALFAATIACAQDDIKRVLAYSTISQLGYMFLAEGSGGYHGRHLPHGHARLLQGLLFLAAGSVIHALHDEQDMKRMGGSARYLPVTCSAFLVGYLALSAIPPFDGFWSKDDVLAGRLAQEPGPVGGRGDHRRPHRLLHEPAGDAGVQRPGPLAGAQTRAHGAAGTAGAASRSRAATTVKPHESPWVMALPVVILAILSTIGWLINAPFGGLDFLDSGWRRCSRDGGPASTVATGTKWMLGAIATGVAVVGLLAGLRVWQRSPFRPLEPAVLAHGWYIDEGVAATVSGPADRAGQCLQLRGGPDSSTARSMGWPGSRPGPAASCDEYRRATSATTPSASASAPPSSWSTWPPGSGS